MKKAKGRLSNNKKYVSLMLVPHNAGKVKVWKISNPGIKFISVIAFFTLTILVLSGYLVLTINENREIRKGQKVIHDFLMEQQDYVYKNINTISEVEDLDNISKEMLSEFKLLVQDVTENYIDKEVKSLTISRSSSTDSQPVSFVGKIAELRSVLTFLEEAESKEDALFSELSETKEELKSYLDHLPTLWPTTGIIESEFGYRYHPVYKKYLDHSGVDIGGKAGNSIYAAASGIVIFAGSSSGYGNYIDISHENGIVTRYAHCSKLLVKKWQRVNAGDLIAKVGQTGVATGPHLHFEILLNGEAIDPTLFIGTKQQ